MHSRLSAAVAVPIITLARRKFCVCQLLFCMECGIQHQASAVTNPASFLEVLLSPATGAHAWLTSPTLHSLLSIVVGCVWLLLPAGLISTQLMPLMPLNLLLLTASPTTPLLCQSCRLHCPRGWLAPLQWWALRGLCLWRRLTLAGS